MVRLLKEHFFRFQIHSKELHTYMSKRDLSRYFGVDTHDEGTLTDVLSRCWWVQTERITVF